MGEKYRLIVIGAGPAGLTAGIYGARMGLKTLVIGEILGGTVSEGSIVENYPGFVQISGYELSEKMREQAEKCGAILRVPERVLDLELKGKEKKTITDVGAYIADAVIVATGCTHRKLGVSGEEEFKGRGVSYCETCDGPLFKGRRVMVVGGGNSAVMDALAIKELAAKVCLVHRRDDLRADAVLKERIIRSGVEILWNTEVKAIEGDSLVRRVHLYNNKTKQESIAEVNGIFIRIGEIPRSEIASKAGVAVDKDGYIIVNSKQETNIEGVYAAGDITGGIFQIVAAVGGGATAAINAYLYISGGWYGKGRSA